MSGGSFNYLCNNYTPVERFGDYEDMERALVAYGEDGRKVREDFALLMACFRMAIMIHMRLRDVMREVEWHHSADVGEDDVRKVMRAYTEEHS